MKRAHRFTAGVTIVAALVVGAAPHLCLGSVQCCSASALESSESPRGCCAQSAANDEAPRASASPESRPELEGPSRLCACTDEILGIGSTQEAPVAAALANSARRAPALDAVASIAARSDRVPVTPPSGPARARAPPRVR